MNTHYTMRTFLVASLLILQIGCVPIPWRFSKKQLVGIYEIDYPFGRDTLVLRGDDTYEQRFTDRDGRTFINRGKWTLEHRWDNQVRLENAVLVCSPFGKFASTEAQQGYAFFSAGWYAGGIVLAVSEDLGLYMRKHR
jgi:hypothetical protein